MTRSSAVATDAAYGWRYRSVDVLTPPAALAALIAPDHPIAVADLLP